MFRDDGFSWGTVVCTMVAKMMWPYEACPNDTIISIQRGRIRVVQRNHMEISYTLKAMQEVWELLCTTITWFIWIARCSTVFDNTTVHPVESVQNVWIHMVHALKKGRYDKIKGERDAPVLLTYIYIYICCGVVDPGGGGGEGAFL